MTPTTFESTHLRRPAPELPADFRDARLHFLGIGGSGMSGLAALLLEQGARVSGSDAQSSLALVRLMERGATITTRETADTVPPDADFVVASAAIPPDHPARQEARRRSVPIVKYAQMLGALMAGRHGIAIAGTHGKSTTTAWTAFVLKHAGFDPSFIVGAEVDQLGGPSGVGDGPQFVAEACEYDRSFLNLRPRCAAVLNIEEDHLDYYRDLDEIQDAFAEFTAGTRDDGLVVLNGDDERCREIGESLNVPIETFGMSTDATWRAAGLTRQGPTQSFDVLRRNDPLGRVTIGLAGAHNVANALAVIALANHCGVGWEPLRAGLAEFRGVRRRLELRTEVNGIRIVDDYGHHPTEIRVTLQAARDRFQPARLWCIFQPHQHSRTRFLLADLAESFEQADRVVVPDIYFVRDTQRDCEAVCAEDLVERIRRRGGDALYIPGLDQIVDFVAREATAGDVVLTMGAGTIWKVADGLVRRLGGNLPD